MQRSEHRFAFCYRVQKRTIGVAYMAAIDIGPRPKPTGGGLPRKTTVVTCMRVRKSVVVACNTNINSDTESEYGTLKDACLNSNEPSE